MANPFIEMLKGMIASLSDEAREELNLGVSEAAADVDAEEDEDLDEEEDLDEDDDEEEEADDEEDDADEDEDEEDEEDDEEEEEEEDEEEEQLDPESVISAIREKGGKVSSTCKKLLKKFLAAPESLTYTELKELCDLLGVPRRKAAAKCVEEISTFISGLFGPELSDDDDEEDETDDEEELDDEDDSDEEEDDEEEDEEEDEEDDEEDDDEESDGVDEDEILALGDPYDYEDEEDDEVNHIEIAVEALDGADLDETWAEFVKWAKKTGNKFWKALMSKGQKDASTRECTLVLWNAYFVDHEGTLHDYEDAYIRRNRILCCGVELIEDEGASTEEKLIGDCAMCNKKWSISAESMAISEAKAKAKKKRSRRS